jgi:membrane-bound lytic murein transglycosylase B
VKVLDALTTLAFDDPRRAEFFRGELEAFLLLGREQAWDLADVRGYYAGALGLPQFLPSSYRKYAVDFDNDGVRNLWGDPADAIGSVANYYRSYGWEDGAIAVVPASLDEKALSALDATQVVPQRTVREYIEAGAVPLAVVPPEAKAALIRLDTEAGPQYWLGLQNFYVITRYNRSVNYAMAVYELAHEIRQRREAETTLVGER